MPRVCSLLMFLQIADGVDDATWLHHLKAHDYWRWMEEAIKDADLAADVRRAEYGRGDAASNSEASEGSRGVSLYRPGRRYRNGKSRSAGSPFHCHRVAILASYSFWARVCPTFRDRALRPAQRLPSGRGFAFLSLGSVDWRDMLRAMGFQVISGAALREFVENIESATAALDRVRELIELRSPNIRILAEDGRVCSLKELEGLAEFENESDDA